MSPRIEPYIDFDPWLKVRTLADEQNHSILIIQAGEAIAEQINEQVDMALSKYFALLEIKYFALLDDARGW